jgi:cbb3-type cytochrome oxidase maturation protein
MSVIIVLVIISVIVAVCFLAAFIWSVKNGQYEDGYTPSIRILLDDETPNPKKSTGKL